MRNFQDLSGNKYGLLTVLNERTHDKWGKTVWKCKCECGKIAYVVARDLKNGNTRSCGCLLKKISTESYNYKSNKRLYNIYNGIKQRCYNSNSPKYKDYGGRGITMCSQWLQSFESFCKWSLQNGYKEDLSIDRIDVNGNYEPSNCRWATIKVQNNNKRNNKHHN